MLIVDIIQDSFQEYQDNQSLVLFCKGCNFKCTDCYNLDTINNKQPIGEAKQVIDRFLTPMHDAVVFLGGEPTIWGYSLVEAARYVKSKNLKVKVYTNGFNPAIIKELIDNNLVDAFSVDFKCLKDCKSVLGIELESEKYLNIVGKTILMIKEAKIPLKIRTTKFSSLNHVEDVVKYVSKNFPNSEHILQEEFKLEMIAG